MEQAGAVSGRAGLVDRIQKVIVPYKYNNNGKPPFTPDELFTMVIAVNVQPVTKGEVLQWVFANFGYYRKMVEREFISDHSNRISESSIFRGKISDVLCNYELYLKKESVQGEADRYTMTVASCERALSRVLPPQYGLGEKAFRFFDLPPELRNKIFDLVFQYPQSGLRFDYPGQKTARLDPPGNRDTWTWHDLRDSPKTAKIKDVLAPLRVNRQFYEEAKGSFFAVNHLRFSRNFAMRELLAKIPEPQRRHIQHVTLDYQVNRPDVWRAKEAIALLATCGLRKLNLHLRETDWKELGITRRGRVLKHRMDVMNLPGLRKLRTMRGLDEVNFYGCPTVEALIKADMLKPKPKPKKKRTGGTKRKAAGESEGGKKSIRR
ncbi:hypothetical protein KC340_g6060 [Hortaea werneckii]|nr:hypothetical protein KC342_g6305 [Hortaea werneckii]KAI7099153.1 hypothetical protein KC339_g8429 [Hortaea werneckii]KAI7217171.1 hypothetical protein KC365_g13019 [Hortaea werneckii]KAI7325551.1 hypothetical protein KC340_g6060 [Hortaea werneckii]KAI7387133.1 hypothetical protein KC328_g9589 [Hortaea werneckii]